MSYTQQNFNPARKFLIDLSCSYLIIGAQRDVAPTWPQLLVKTLHEHD